VLKNSLVLSPPVSHRAVHILNAVLCPLIDGMLALSTVGGELREALLEGETENADINVVAELLAHHEEVVPEDERSEQVDDVGTASRQSQRCLVQKDEKCYRGHPVQLQCAQLLEQNI